MCTRRVLTAPAVCHAGQAGSKRAVAGRRACRLPAGSGNVSRIVHRLARLDPSPHRIPSGRNSVSVSPKAALVALALSVAIAMPAGAVGENPWTFLSPWTLSRSGYFFQTTASYTSTSEFYDAIGNKQTTPSSLTYREFTTNLHLEYGLRNSVGLLLYVPVRDMKQELAAPPD